MFLQIDNVSVTLGKFSLRNINLDIKKGEYVTIIGPSGSGKSILLENIAGFYEPDEGRVYLKGEDITDKEIEDRHISIVYQDYVLFPHMSVYENILYGLKKIHKNKNENDKDIHEISKLLKINHLLDRKPLTLSGGEMQRVSIARALVVKPELLLMDEAFSALDYKIKKDMRILVKNAAKKYGTTVLHVTHDFDDVWAMADKSVVLRYGEILQVGTPEEIFSQPNSDFVADFVGANIFKAKVVRKEGDLSVLEANGFEVISISQVNIGDEFRVAIRPENIIIEKDKTISSVQNELAAKILKIEKKGFLVEMDVLVGGETLVVVITSNSYDNLKLCEGSSVYLSFKAVNVNLY